MGSGRPRRGLEIKVITTREDLGRDAVFQTLCMCDSKIKRKKKKEKEGRKREREKKKRGVLEKQKKSRKVANHLSQSVTWVLTFVYGV